MYLKIVFICILTTVICIYLKAHIPQYATVLSAFVSVTVSAVCILSLSPAIDYLKELVSDENFYSYGQVMLKVCGIGLITKTASEMCADAQEKSIAGKVELAGKTAIILCALPVVRTLLTQVREFIK